MFRFAFLAFALIAVGALLFGGAQAAGATMLVFAPLLILGKIFLVLVLFGVIGGFFWRGSEGRPPSRSPWARRRPRSQAPREKSREEQFEDWHRLAHAQDEVDGWTEDLD